MAVSRRATSLALITAQSMKKDWCRLGTSKVAREAYSLKLKVLSEVQNSLTVLLARDLRIFRIVIPARHVSLVAWCRARVMHEYGAGNL